MMKLPKKHALTLLTVVGLTLSSVSQAALINSGSGLIYDDVLDVTWLQDAGYAKTSGHDADGLSYPGGVYGIIDDWRLADVNLINFISFNYGVSVDDSTDYGFNIDSIQSELSYMNYQNLENIGYFDTSGNIRDCSLPNSCEFQTELFENLLPHFYWPQIEYGAECMGVRYLHWYSESCA